MNGSQDKRARLKPRSQFVSTVMMFLVLILCDSCSILSQKKQTELTQTLWFYRSAIRWGRYTDALEFQKNPQKDFNFLSVSDVKVSWYTVERKAFSDDGDRLDQTVEIRYIREPGIVEKTIFDQQTWLYEDEGWVLDGELPHFK